MIEHTVRVMPKKRQVEDLIEKRKKIGELLKLEKVPLHVLAWKEDRLELGDGDCYPVIDILEALAGLVGTKVLKPDSDGLKKHLEELTALTCGCGFEAKSKAGLAKHKGSCLEVLPTINFDE